MPNLPKSMVTFGGWYQRTTLHLSEVYDLLALGRSKLDLQNNKLKDFKKLLDIKEATRETESLEYVKATTNSGIKIKYFEDGLYVFNVETNNINAGQRLLEQYFENVFNPAISYIFSLGAPTPKVLANIKITHPTVISVITNKPSLYKVNVNRFGEVYGKISSKNITVLKTPEYIFLASSKKDKKVVEDVVEMQIFFREFKDQLEKYLDIHRMIWEKIENIKKKKSIKGKEIEETREQLESYRKTIDLIQGRINQMGSYVDTRRSISKELDIEKHLNILFQYKFEILSNTHTYINDIWIMTKEHISSAIEVMVELENKTTRKSIQALQVITSIGVVSGILGYLARNELPTITSTGLIFFALLILLTFLINLIVAALYKNIKYKLKFTRRTKKI